jgi:hypothetical protein
MVVRYGRLLMSFRLFKWTDQSKTVVNQCMLVTNEKQKDLLYERSLSANYNMPQKDVSSHNYVEFKFI